MTCYSAALCLLLALLLAGCGHEAMPLVWVWPL